jgi:hypothetical protein
VSVIVIGPLGRQTADVRDRHLIAIALQINEFLWIVPSPPGEKLVG